LFLWRHSSACAFRKEFADSFDMYEDGAIGLQAGQSARLDFRSQPSRRHAQDAGGHGDGDRFILLR